jgi:hypothetical protein
LVAFDAERWDELQAHGSPFALLFAKGVSLLTVSSIPLLGGTAFHSRCNRE